jgi:predicted DNA-binding protein YlxM (UPF0122 family)
MISKTQIEQIRKDYLNQLSLRKIAAKNNVSLQTVVKNTRDLGTALQEKEKLLKKKNIYNNINNTSTLNTLYEKLPEQVLDKKGIDKIEVSIDKEKENKRLIINKENNVYKEDTNIKIIDNSIKKILKELKNINYSKSNLKDLTASLNQLTKQRQELTGSNNDNKTLLAEIFGSNEAVQQLLQEIRESKSDPTGYIIKSQAIPEQ